MSSNQDHQDPNDADLPIQGEERDRPGHEEDPEIPGTQNDSEPEQVDVDPNEQVDPNEGEQRYQLVPETPNQLMNSNQNVPPVRHTRLFMSFRKIRPVVVNRQQPHFSCKMNKNGDDTTQSSGVYAISQSEVQQKLAIVEKENKVMNFF